MTEEKLRIRKIRRLDEVQDGCHAVVRREVNSKQRVWIIEVDPFQHIHYPVECPYVVFPDDKKHDHPPGEQDHDHHRPGEFYLVENKKAEQHDAIRTSERDDHITYHQEHQQVFAFEERNFAGVELQVHIEKCDHNERGVGGLR